MNHWYTLKIEKTDDKNAVKAAYMALLPSHNPEDDPQGFANLRTAYEQALKEIDGDTGGIKSSNDAVTAFFAEIGEIYNNFAKRIDPAHWEEALKSDVCTALDTEEEVDVKMLEFLSKNHNMPTNVWETLDSRFRWTHRADELRKRYGPGLINSIVGTVSSKFDLHYELFDCDPGADVDRFIFLRNALTTAIDNRKKEEADTHFEEIRSTGVRHPIYDIEMARYLSLSGENDEALEKINLEIQKHPEFENEPFTLYVKATVLLNFTDKDKLEESLNTYNKAIEIVPKYFYAQLGVVDALVKQEEYDKAEAYLTDVMLLENPSHDYLYRYFHHVSGLNLKKYEALYEESPTPEIAEKLAKYYTRNNQHDKCIELLENNEKTGQACYLLGHSYHKLNQHDTAIKYAQESIEKMQKYSAYILLSEVYLARRYYEKTVENADNGLSAGLPEEGKEMLGKARLLSDKAYALKKLKKHEQALEVINQAIDLNGNMCNLYADKSEILMDMGRYSDAYAEAEKSMNLMPTWARPHELMAEIFYWARNYDQMAEVFKKAEEMQVKSHGLTYLKGCRKGAIKEYDQCNETLSALLKEENLDIWEEKTLDALCFYNQAAKKYENMAEYAQKLVEFFKSNDFKPTVDAYIFLAAAYKSLKATDKEYEALAQGLSVIPDNERLLTQLGYHYDAAKSPEGHNIWVRIIELNPKNAIPYNRIAMLLSSKDKYQEAVDILNQGLEQIPGSVNLMGRRGYIHSDMGEYQKAVDDCLYVVENLGKQYSWWTKGSMYFEVAWIYSQKLNNDEAATKYFMLTKENNGFTSNWRKGFLADLYEKQGDLENAIDTYSKCIESDPKDEFSIFSRGKLYKKTGEHAKAEADFNQVIEMITSGDKESHDLYRLVGSAYLEIGDPDNAKIYYEKAEVAIKTDGTKNGICFCIHQNWAKYYKHIGQYEKALEQINLAIGLSNSIKNNELKQEIEQEIAK